MRDQYGINNPSYKHGLWNHPIYTIWNAMMNRCYNEACIQFKDYGGRGIYVFDNWHNVSNFIDEMFPSYEKGLSLDRIDNNWHYYKENCRWATRAEQAFNKNNTIEIEINGKIKPLLEWCEEYKVPYMTAYSRLKRGEHPIFYKDNYHKTKRRRSRWDLSELKGKDLFS